MAVEEETGVENWRVGSTNIHVTEGQGLCAVRGARRVRNLLALKHLGVDEWESKNPVDYFNYFRA